MSGAEPSGDPSAGGGRARVTVTGGSGGIAADYAAMTALAGRFGAAAGDTLGSALTLHGYLLAAAQPASSLLDPVGLLAFEAELTAALDGPRGLTWVGAGLGALDGELRLAARAYVEADRLITDTRDAVTGAVRLPVAVNRAGTVLARTHDVGAALESVVATDPQLADTVVTLLGLPAGFAVAARTVPDGHGVVRETGPAKRALAPRTLPDLMTGLAQRNADPHHGAVDVRILHNARRRRRRVIVDVTGTKSWTPLPTSDITSLTTNGRALTGSATAYERGVLNAMRRAGVRPDDDVMFVGHSQGGLVALTAARDAVRDHRFRVTHVVTAGAPIGLVADQVPASVQVLALENARDVVPHLDGRANPDRRNVTTATVDRGGETVSGNHDVRRSYVAAARDVQASGNRSVRDFMAGAGAYFDADSAQVRTFQIRREY
jgi:hypothetical protein